MRRSITSILTTAVRRLDRAEVAWAVCSRFVSSFAAAFGGKQRYSSCAMANRAKTKHRGQAVIPRGDKPDVARPRAKT
ncbi:MAG: hypothetical protein ACJ79U_19490 [Myxococcales bacterium]